MDEPYFGASVRNKFLLTYCLSCAPELALSEHLTQDHYEQLGAITFNLNVFFSVEWNNIALVVINVVSYFTY